LIIGEEPFEETLAIFAGGSTWHPRQKVRAEITTWKLLFPLESDFDRVAPVLGLKYTDFEISVE
jgi:hypothetical protein